MEEIEQVPNTYYYDKLYDDKHLGSFTEITAVAYQLGWQDNTVAITDTEVSELNGWTYLKGFAPKKTESMILIEQYQSEIVELKKYLSDTDYKAIKFAEGELSEEAYREDKLQRHNARVRINELESLIEELEKENKKLGQQLGLSVQQGTYSSEELWIKLTLSDLVFLGCF